MAFCPKCHIQEKNFWAPKCHACNTPVGFVEQCVYSLMQFTIYAVVFGGAFLALLAFIG